MNLSRERKVIGGIPVFWFYDENKISLMSAEKGINQRGSVNIATWVFMRNIRVLGPSHESRFPVFSRNAYELNIQAVCVRRCWSSFRHYFPMDLIIGCIYIFIACETDSFLRKILRFWSNKQFCKFSLVRRSSMFPFNTLTLSSKTFTLRF